MGKTRIEELESLIAAEKTEIGRWFGKDIQEQAAHIGRLTGYEIELHDLLKKGFEANPLRKGR